jgi:hypothetical protein
MLLCRLVHSVDNYHIANGMHVSFSVLCRCTVMPHCCYCCTLIAVTGTTMAAWRLWCVYESSAATKEHSIGYAALDKRLEGCSAWKQRFRIALLSLLQASVNALECQTRVYLRTKYDQVYTASSSLIAAIAVPYGMVIIVEVLKLARKPGSALLGTAFKKAT